VLRFVGEAAFGEHDESKARTPSTAYIHSLFANMLLSLGMKVVTSSLLEMLNPAWKSVTMMTLPIALLNSHVMTILVKLARSMSRGTR
jgi:hypothetical protein